MIKSISRIRGSNLWHSAWHMPDKTLFLTELRSHSSTTAYSLVLQVLSHTGWVRPSVGDVRMATARSFIDIINQLQPLYFVHIGFESYSVERAEEMILFIEVIWLYTVFRSLYPNVIKLAQNTLLEISWDGKRLLLYNQVQDYRRVYRIAQRSQGI